MSESTTTIPKSYVGDGTTINIVGNVVSAVDPTQLGEVKMFALSTTGAVTKATLNAKGWAICDGTDTATQVTTPTITGNTPDLRSKFLRHSANETTGGTGGTTAHNHLWAYDPAGGSANECNTWTSDGSTEQNIRNTVNNGSGSSPFMIRATATGDAYYTQNTTTSPPYFDVCYFMKVK